MLLRDDLLEAYDLNRLNAHLQITTIPEPFFHYRESNSSLLAYAKPVESVIALLPEGMMMEGLSVTPGPLPGFDVQRMPMENYLKASLASPLTVPPVTKRKSAPPPPEPKRPRQSSMVTTSRY